MVVWGPPVLLIPGFPWGSLVLSLLWRIQPALRHSHTPCCFVYIRRPQAGFFSVDGYSEADVQRLQGGMARRHEARAGKRTLKPSTQINLFSNAAVIVWLGVGCPTDCLGYIKAVVSFQTWCTPTPPQALHHFCAQRFRTNFGAFRFATSIPHAFRASLWKALVCCPPVAGGNDAPPFVHLQSSMVV